VSVQHQRNTEVDGSNSGRVTNRSRTRDDLMRIAVVSHAAPVAAMASDLPCFAFVPVWPCFSKLSLLEGKVANI
jgi:hypothetical protein